MKSEFDELEDLLRQHRPRPADEKLRKRVAVRLSRPPRARHRGLLVAACAVLALFGALLSLMRPTPENRKSAANNAEKQPDRSGIREPGSALVDSILGPDPCVLLPHAGETVRVAPWSFTSSSAELDTQ